MHITQHSVLEFNSLLETLQELQKGRQQSTLLIACCRRDLFEKWLLAELQNVDVQDDKEDEMGDTLPPSHRMDFTQHSLRAIKAFDAITTVFCSDVAHLRAYLSSIVCDVKQENSTEGKDQDQPASLLVVLNIIRIHHDSMAYSASEINRTLASMIDSANHLKSHAVLCELQLPIEISSTSLEIAPNLADADTMTQTYSFDEDVGIVDPKTRTFGPGTRGWTGRTIKLRQIAERWFVFVNTLEAKS